MYRAVSPSPFASGGSCETAPSAHAPIPIYKTALLQAAPEARLFVVEGRSPVEPGGRPLVPGYWAASVRHWVTASKMRLLVNVAPLTVSMLTE